MADIFNTLMIGHLSAIKYATVIIKDQNMILNHSLELSVNSDK